MTFRGNLGISGYKIVSNIFYLNSFLLSLINAEAQSSLNAAPRLSWDAYYPVNEVLVLELSALHQLICIATSKKLYHKYNAAYYPRRSTNS